MKKFLSMVCISTPSVKGIYTALFILILSTAVFSQIELKDNNNTVPFYKWDVSFDLKPLFRKEEPFDLLVKRYTSPTKAWRFGLGLFASRSPINKDYLDILNPDSNVYVIIRKTTNQINTYLTIGRQFEKKKDRFNIYTCSDITVNVDFNRDQSGLVDLQGFDPKTGLYPINKVYLDTVLNNRSIALVLSQSLGFKYHFNKQISVSMEANGLLNFSKIDNMAISIGSIITNKGVGVVGAFFNATNNHWLYYLKVNPIAHIYLSYHF